MIYHDAEQTKWEPYTGIAQNAVKNISLTCHAGTEAARGVKTIKRSIG